MDHLQRGWEIVRADILAWVLLFAVFSAAVTLTGGLGMLLLPNLMRVVRDAIDQGRTPDPGGLLKFDDVSDEIVVMLLKLVADGVGSLLCGVGALVTQVLFFWAPLIAVERRYGAVEAMKASLAHASGAIGSIVWFSLLLFGFNVLGLLTCCVGLYLTAPISMVATWLYWIDHREAVYAAADAKGVPRRA